MAKKKPIRLCSVPGCERVHRSNGFCGSHDEQYKRGVTDPSNFKPFKWDGAVCDIAGCPVPVYAKRLCRTHYGICNSFSVTSEKLQELYDRPCEICGSEDDVIHVDHDHSCCPGTRSCGDCIRGGLCGGCNMALGAFNDSPEVLRKALQYLERPRPDKLG